MTRWRNACRSRGSHTRRVLRGQRHHRRNTVALLTLVGVATHMRGQRRSLTERLRAHVAHIRPVTRVALQVAEHLLARAKQTPFRAATSVPVAPVAVLATTDMALGKMLHEVAGGRERLSDGTPGPLADVERALSRRSRRWRRGRGELEAAAMVVVRVGVVAAVRVGVGMPRHTRFGLDRWVHVRRMDVSVAVRVVMPVCVRVTLRLGLLVHGLCSCITVPKKLARDTEMLLEQVAKHGLRAEWLACRRVVRVRMGMRMLRVWNRGVLMLRARVGVERRQVDAACQLVEREAVVPEA